MQGLDVTAQRPLSLFPLDQKTSQFFEWFRTLAEGVQFRECIGHESIGSLLGRFNSK